MLKIGCDPELFVKKNGVYHTAYGLIPGTKECPYPVEKGMVQVDGMALEIGIEPAETPEEFKHNLKTVLNHLREMVPSEYEFAVDPIAEFSKEHMMDMPEEALALGCMPDWDAYTGNTNPSPRAHPVMRTAAGHVHVGMLDETVYPYDQEHIANCCEYIKEMDYHVGLPSVILDPDDKRKEMYGKAGAFRPKPYGFEYRTPSNYWLKSDGLMDLIFRNTRIAVRSMRDGVTYFRRYGTLARDIINSNNRKEAMLFCQKEGIIGA